MIHTARQGFHNTLHLQLKKQGCQLSDTEARLHAKYVQL